MRTLLVPELKGLGTLSVDGDEAHHGRNVLRLSQGDPLALCDGAGQVAQATVISVKRHQLQVEISHIDQVESPAAFTLRVAMAAPKGSLFDATVRGLTELGVGRIAVFPSERGVRVPSLERARRITREAIKQCRSAHLPQIESVADIPSLAQGSDDLILLDPQGGSGQPSTPTPTTLVIGPEGGLTPDEIGLLVELGARSVRLVGPILRIETAALAAAAVWAHAWEHTP